MLNELLAAAGALRLSGKRVYCAVSGGADSVALLFGLYLLREKLQLELRAAHFNHGLRGDESDRDEQFVRELCRRYEIPLEVGSARVEAGDKGLEAAAREARYAFFATLPGLVATAHTADDNAETVLMHLVRGTGLRGLGGIAPARDFLVRPMLAITREQVLDFLREYRLQWVEDSTNSGDLYLRNRLRHRVIPLLKEENPRFAENVSALAVSLREDAALLDSLATREEMPTVSRLQQLEKPLRSRLLEQFLKNAGVKEPERAHMELAERLVFSQKPSAWASFPGGVTVHRTYDSLQVLPQLPDQAPVALSPGLQLCRDGWRITCACATEPVNTPTQFTFSPDGQVMLRSRLSGDRICLPGGTKTLKKLFIDRKIPASLRAHIPVVADDAGVVGVCGIGADVRRAAQAPVWRVSFEKINDSHVL